MISRKGSALSTESSLKAKCYRDAYKYCIKRGLVMVPVSFTGHEPGFGIMGSCEVVFRAVSTNDYENARPNMIPGADVIIEHRER